MAIELGAIIEGDGTAQGLGHRLEQGDERSGNGLGPQAIVTQRHGEPGVALMDDEEGLTGLRKQHGVGFPMAGLAAGGDGWRALVDRTAPGGTWPAALGAPAALVFGAGQIEAPAPIIGALELGINEAVDGLMADDRAARFMGEAP